MDELLILVDANDQQTGVANKLKAHQEGLLHRAFSLFVFDSRGWLLLQRRAPEKYHSGGLWTNTCCGHPRDGEPTEDAAHRRLGEEMGFDCALQEVTAFIYEAQVPGGLIEHEFDHVYIGRHDGEPVPNPAEASDWRWIEPHRLLSWMGAEPELFTVGEMLTTFFIDYEPALGSQRALLSRLSVSFGAALQLTNILKDQWEDRQQGICWLPQDLFAEHAVELLALQAGQRSPGFDRALCELVGTAHAHLQRALEYALLIPAKHDGIRRFLLWTIGLTLLTLRKIHARPGFSSEPEVRISRSQVALMMRLTRASQRSNTGLRLLFKFAARRLPLTPLDAQWHEAAWAIHQWPRSSIDFLADPPSNSGI